MYLLLSHYHNRQIPMWTWEWAIQTKLRSVLIASTTFVNNPKAVNIGNVAVPSVDHLSGPANISSVISLSHQRNSSVVMRKDTK